MKICINVLIEKDAPTENFLEFFETLKKTSGNFSVCIVNNSSNRFLGIADDTPFDNVHFIQNNVDVGFVTATNQGLYNSSSKFDYSFCVNSKYALVVEKDWLTKAMGSLGAGGHYGGHIFPVKITNSEKMQKILYSICDSNDLSWLSKWANRYMVLPCIDNNIFVVKNSSLESIRLPNSKYCDASSYGISLSLSFMKVGFSPTSLESIYSSQTDTHRYDIFSVIKNGAGIVYPVVIDSVRNRLKS